MPAPSIRINGGSPGIKAAIAATTSFSATLDDASGVRTVEWWIASTDETSETSDYTLTASGSVGQTVTTTSLGLGTAALLHVRINGGIDAQTGNPSPETTEASCKFGVVLSNGMWVGCAGEEMEHDPTYGATEILNSGARAAASGGGVPDTRQIIAGAGLTGGGTLAADRTLNVVANADASIVVNANDIQVGVLASDAQHGNRGGGGIHATAIASGAAGFMSGSDKAKLDGIAAGAEVVTAGAGLTKSGSTIDVVAADASITVGANSIEASGDFVAKNVTTTGSYTAGTNGFIGPKVDTSGASTLSIGPTNATAVYLGRSGQTVRLVAHTTAGLLTNNGSGDIASVNGAVLSVGALTNVSNARNISALTSQLDFERSGGVPVLFRRSEASDTGLYDVIMVGRTHASAGAPTLATGIGLFGTDDGGGEPTIGRLSVEMTDVGSGTYASTAGLWIAAAGALVQAYTFTNATLALGGRTITKCTSVASDLALALTSASGDASLDADGASTAKVGTSTANATSIGRSTKTTTITSGTEAHVLDNDSTITEQWGTSGFTVSRRKSVTTNNNTPTTAFTFAIPANAAGHVELHVNSVDVTNGESAYYEKRYRFARRASGTSTFATVGTDIDGEDDIDWRAEVTHSSPTLTASVIGDAANQTQHDVFWIVRYETFLPI